MVEGLACRKTAYWARELGFTFVILEGDSKIVIERLLQGGDDSTELGAILVDVRDLLFNVEVSFYRTNRQFNQPAHVLARFVKNVLTYLSWTCMPNFLVQSILGDLPN